MQILQEKFGKTQVRLNFAIQHLGQDIAQDLAKNLQQTIAARVSIQHQLVAEFATILNARCGPSKCIDACTVSPATLGMCGTCQCTVDGSLSWNPPAESAADKAADAAASAQAAADAQAAAQAKLAAALNGPAEDAAAQQGNAAGQAAAAAFAK